MADLGLPQLMDRDRVRGFFIYTVSGTLPFLLDGVLYLILGWKRTKLLLQLSSVAACGAFTAVLWAEDGVRTEPFECSAYETNGAIISLTSIIRTLPDFHWTIVSANDETQMAIEHGWHYETLTLLNSMRDYDEEKSEMFLPTDYVFFFIEKIPLDYQFAYEGSGQKVSRKGAEMPLVQGTAVKTIYTGEARWICMSHMYYWMQAFREMFPNEVQVYYEDEEFVCYVVPQDAYSLYNFAIDYGYNGER